MPTTFLLSIGMLPTFVALLIDHSPGKNKAFTIGAMNFAGCFPYLLGVWTTTNSIEASIHFLSDPVTVIVMYGLAGLGYIINWATVLGVSSILIERSQNRLKRIEHEKKMLEERWGNEVSGKYPLDDFGFRLQPDIDSAEE
ncbi:MAG: hypothetical protein MRY79_07260 [Alphaproteobacteria bacterium]|nr:hypothetical protein [Alphaproteobacteria bacterium]